MDDVLTKSVHGDSFVYSAFMYVLVGGHVCSITYDRHAHEVVVVIHGIMCKVQNAKACLGGTVILSLVRRTS